MTIGTIRRWMLEQVVRFLRLWPVATSTGDPGYFPPIFKVSSPLSYPPLRVNPSLPRCLRYVSRPRAQFCIGGPRSSSLRAADKEGEGHRADHTEDEEHDVLVGLATVHRDPLRDRGAEEGRGDATRDPGGRAGPNRPRPAQRGPPVPYLRPAGATDSGSPSRQPARAGARPGLHWRPGGDRQGSRGLRASCTSPRRWRRWLTWSSDFARVRR